MIHLIGRYHFFVGFHSRDNRMVAALAITGYTVFSIKRLFYTTFLHKIEKTAVVDNSLDTLHVIAGV